jgi:hypothetical protein
MKKIVLIGTAALLSFSAFAGRKMNLVKISSGSKFNDISKSVKQELDDKVADGVSLKVTFTKGGNIGAYNPKLKNWSNAEKLVLQILNPTKKILQFDLVIVPKDLKGKSRYNARSDNKVLLKPGMNKIVMELGDFTNNSGDPLELNNIVQYYINPTAKALKATGGTITIYIKKIYIEME